MLWDEGIEDEFDDATINNQFVTMYFIDVDDPIDNSTAQPIVDAKVPYARINLTTDLPFEARVNHMASFFPQHAVQTVFFWSWASCPFDHRNQPLLC